jgi:uncharacterized protein involved in type VI secretion and phage assembly
MNNDETENLLVEIADWKRSRFFGKYRGIVKDNQDQENLGRLRVEVPEIYGKNQKSPWALPCVPYSGDGSGVYTIPDPGAGVWIEFEAGDISRPIWVGCWWAKGELPKDNGGVTVTPPIKIMRSEKGLMVTLDDKNQIISLTDKTGKNLLKIEVQSGKITLKGTSKAIVDAPQIELVENSMHQVVLGDQLLQYLNQLVSIFNSHVHGSTPPPTPIYPPASNALLSNKVKTG